MAVVVTRLDPPIWLHTPKGEARAHFLIITDDESDDQWKCLQQDSGEWWTWINSEVRGMKNITLGRLAISAIGSRP